MEVLLKVVGDINVNKILVKKRVTMSILGIPFQVIRDFVQIDKKIFLVNFKGMLRVASVPVITYDFLRIFSPVLLLKHDC